MAALGRRASVSQQRLTSLRRKEMQYRKCIALFAAALVGFGVIAADAAVITGVKITSPDSGVVLGIE
jgi:hypothetical protein